MNKASALKFFADNKTLSCRKHSGTKVLIYILENNAPAIVDCANK